MTRAPAAAAICTTFMPTPPQPNTATVSPGRTSPRRVTAWKGVDRASAMTLPSSSGTLSGSRKTSFSGRPRTRRTPLEVVAEHAHRLADVLASETAARQRPHVSTAGSSTRSPGLNIAAPSPHPATMPTARAEDERRLLEGLHAMVEVVQVGVADAARRDPHQDLARAGLRHRAFSMVSDGRVRGRWPLSSVPRHRCLQVGGALLEERCSPSLASSLRISSFR